LAGTLLTGSLAELTSWRRICYIVANDWCQWAGGGRRKKERTHGIHVERKGTE
ncbi:hypothetical protein P7K49_012350, partial [Saguinus oedipus]